jgi:beta-1,4-mannosyltransferase
VAKMYERAVAPLADAHLTVTHAMKSLLERDILCAKQHADAASSTMSSIHVVVDCPPSMFQPRSLEEQHAILTKLDAVLRASCPRQWSSFSSSTTTTTNSKFSNGGTTIAAASQTLFTECYCSDGDDDGKEKHYRPRRGRPALVTSSTSWTSDEDFGILLAALLLLDEQIQQQQQLGASSSACSLKVLVIVTGKGPQKAMYEERISRLTLQHVAVATLWLQPADYPRLIACADVGVSLHTSTSGFDLPMKVLDMFGCQVPVLAKDFACLSELVVDNVNGRIFNNSHQLANLLWELLEPMTRTTCGPVGAGPGNHSFGPLARYSCALEGRERWSDNWLRHAQPIILKAAKKHVLSNNSKNK